MAPVLSRENRRFSLTHRSRACLGLLFVLASIALMPCGAARAQETKDAAKAEEPPAAAEIKKLGGRFDLDDKDAEKPIVGVNFGATALDDAALGGLKDLPKLKKLIVNN